MATRILAPGGANTPANNVTSDDTKRAPDQRNRLIPQHRREFEDRETIGRQSLTRANELAVTWWSVLENLRESDACGESRKGTLPAWARELIGTFAEQDAAHEEHRQWHEAASRALMLAEGEQVPVFEVWTKSGQRLDGQHQFWTQAEASRNRLAERFPGAYVCRVHPRAPISFAHEPAMLDTLIGRTYWCGVTFGEPGAHNLHTVQDSTGRMVTVPSDVLLAHEAFQRMTADGRSCVQSHAGKGGAA